MLRGIGLYLYNIVCGSHPNAVTIRMKGNSTHKTSMLIERVNTLLGLPVPQPHSLVVTTGNNQAAIRGEPSSTDPVAVVTQAELELLTIHCPHLVTIATEER